MTPPTASDTERGRQALIMSIVVDHHPTPLTADDIQDEIESITTLGEMVGRVVEGVRMLETIEGPQTSPRPGGRSLGKRSNTDG